MILLDKEYPASSDAIRSLYSDLKACLTRFGYTDSEQDPFVLSASEVFTNALKHAEVLPSFFKVSLVLQGKSLSLSLYDDGAVFNGFEEAAVASEKQGAGMMDGLLETSGIGLFLSGRDFDSFTYERIKEGNCYTLLAPSPLKAQKPSLLIIDDDAAQRDLITLYLSDDYDMEHAGSGKDAMSLLESIEAKPDLILCDVVMRDGNGVEFCQALQKDKELALIPFIFMTGEPEASVARAAEDLPANDFLQKPIQKNGLLKTLKRTLAKARQDRKILGDKLDKDMTSVLAPSLPEQIGDYHFVLEWQAAEAGGGDIALHLKGDECDHVIVMDIMGHGEQAKFFSHSFAGYLNGFLSAQSSVADPAEILTALSHFLFTDRIGEKTILTAQIVTILKDGSLKIASAGHPPPLLCDGDDVYELAIEGSMPGLMSDTAYESAILQLEPQQRLALYTDGLFEVGDNAEAMSKHKEVIIDHIKSMRSVCIPEGSESIWNAFLEQTAGKAEDDALLIMIQRD